MPGLQIDCKGAVAFASSLVNIACGGVKVLQHWHEPVALAIRPTNETSTRPHIMDMKADSTRVFADGRTVFESVINPVNTVIFHRQEKARGELLTRCSSIKERGCGVREEFSGEQIVSLKGPWKIRGP